MMKRRTNPFIGEAFQALLAGNARRMAIFASCKLSAEVIGAYELVFPLFDVDHALQPAPVADHRMRAKYSQYGCCK